MNYLREYIHLRLYRREIRSTLRKEGLPLVAECMWRLNRRAYSDPINREMIYSYKNVLVKHFYRIQPHLAGVQVQSMECWECEGSGYSMETGESCWKCEGSGIHREHRLFVFRFEIGGRRYVWHQPERLVDWPVELSADHEPAEFTPRDLPDGDIWLSWPDLERCLAVVYEWLRSQGEQPWPPSLRYAMTLKHTLGRQIEQDFPSLEKLRRAIAAWRDEPNDEQIPF